MTTRLSLYNGALRLLGERNLASLTENREPRRVLDNVWDDGAVNYCLEQGFWNFAMRTMRLDFDADSSPAFGYRNAFSKPDDWIRTAAVCTDEAFNNPLTQYADEAGYWYADDQEIYVQFVSLRDDYGNDLSRWPQTFTRYVEAYLALGAAPRILQNDGKEAKIEKGMRKALTDARSKDAMNEPVKFLPQGGWSRSRMGGRPVERTGSRLIG